jgi:hypothetical protein
VAEGPPELFAWLFPVVGEDPGLRVAGSVDPRFVPPVVPPVPGPGVPSKDPHGDPLGDVPGVVELFGFTVEG